MLRRRRSIERKEKFAPISSPIDPARYISTGTGMCAAASLRFVLATNRSREPSHRLYSG
jgi:hypothetical protein